MERSCFYWSFLWFYTVNHPLNYTRRNQGLEKALPIKVGNNCWFGANVSVMLGGYHWCRGVDFVGAVVTKNMPENSPDCRCSSKSH